MCSLIQQSLFHYTNLVLSVVPAIGLLENFLQVHKDLSLERIKLVKNFREVCDVS